MADAERSPGDQPVVSAEERLEYLARSFGSNRVAELLGVSKSQPSRWRSGKDRMSPENRRRLIDLDYVMSRLLAFMYPEQAKIWLTSFNPMLGGRPIDALEMKGAGGVIAAIDAEEQAATH